MNILTSETLYSAFPESKLTEPAGPPPVIVSVGDLGIVSRRGGEPELPTTVYRNPIERSEGRASRGGNGLGRYTRDADDGGAAFESSC